MADTKQEMAETVCLTPASEAQAPAVPDGPIDHRRNCPAWTNAQGYEVNGEDCTCGKRWRIDIQTLHELRAAWEKRAYESEAEVASLREKLTKYKNIADAVEGYTEYMNADELISAFIKEQERLREKLEGK